MDYFLWNEVERRMMAGKAKGKETVGQYKARLRRTAKSIPTSMIKRAVKQMKKRASAVVKEKGGDIDLD